MTNAEEVNEFRELVEDQHVLEHFFNYNGLKKSFAFCESKVQDTINMKMIAGVEKSRWFKIKYIHILAKLCGIQENLFDIKDIQMPEMTDENMKVIDSIKKLYDKRDKTKVSDYDIDTMQQLYKFMIDSLTKKLKLISSSKCRKSGENRDKVLYKINKGSIAKYERLIKIMNPSVKNKIDYTTLDCDEEE